MNNELLLRLIITASDLASKDITKITSNMDGLNAQAKEFVDTTLFSNEFSRSAEGMRSFSDAIKESTQPLADSAKNALALSTAITAVASYMAKQAYDSAVKYESALADLNKVLDKTDASAKTYGESLNNIALKYGQSGEELVSAMSNFVQAGYKASEAFKLVEESTKLMIAGEVDASQSSQLLVSILKGFNAPATDAAKSVDILNEVSNKYATNVKELATGMAAISPIAKQMGFSMEETAGLLTPVIEVYQSGSEAADALKTGLQKLTDNSAPVKDALASIGVSQLDLNGNMRSGKEIFLDVAKAMTGLDAAQKQFVISQLVGIEQAGKMTQVFDNLSGYLSITETALSSTGSALNEVNTRLKTAEYSNKRAEESFRQLSVTLGTAFKPQITGVIDATGELARAFDSAVKAGNLAPLLNAIKPQIFAVQELFYNMASNLDAALARVDWTPLVNGIKEFSSEFGDAFAALTEGMDLTTVEGLQELLQRLINLMGNFAQYIAGVVDGLEPFMDGLNALFKIVSENRPTIAKLSGEIQGLALSANKAIPFILEWGSKIFGAVGSVIELTSQVGLLIAAFKLLTAAGIPVGTMLSGLLARFMALSPAAASVVTALAGFPGLILGISAAVGTATYSIASLVAENTSLTATIMDWKDSLTGAREELERGATQEELAAARAARLAREKKAEEEATRKATEAKNEEQQKNEQTLKAQEQKIAANAAETETIKRLSEQAKALGMIYDETTGEYIKQTDLTAKQKQAQLELGAALDSVGVAAGAMSGRITASGQEMLATLNKIVLNTQATSKEIAAAIYAMIPRAETEAELEAIRKKIEQLGNDGKLTGEQAANGLAMIADRAKNLITDPVFESLTKSLEKIRNETELGIEVSDRDASVKKAQTDAAILLAKAKGDEATASKLTADSLQEELQQSAKRIDQLKDQRDQLTGHINLLFEQANADGRYDDAERKVIETLKNKKGVLDEEIAKIEAKLPLQEQEARQAKILAGPIGELTRLYQQSAEEHQRAAKASEDYYATQLNEIDGAMRVAQAKGDEAEIDRLQAEQNRVRIDQAYSLADAKSQEATDAYNAVSAKELELAADGALTAADNEMIATMKGVAQGKAQAAQQARDNAVALEEEIKATTEAAEKQKKAAKEAKEHEEQTKAAGDAFNAILNGWNSRLEKLGEAAHQAWMTMDKGIMRGTQSTADFTSGLSEAEKGLRKVSNDLAQLNYAETTAAVGFAKWANTVAAGALQIEESFYTQSVAAEQLTEKLKTLSGRALEEVIKDAELAKERFGLLDEQTLDNLQSEIDAAKEKLQEMSEETQSAKDRLMELNAELLELQGQDEKSKKLKEQLDYEQQLAEIERQRAQAELEGNRELIATLDEQRRILEQIHQQKLTNIKTESDAAKKEENNTKTSSSKTSSSSSGGTTTSGGTTNNVVNNFYIDPTKLASEEWVRKNVLPTINRVQNWTR